MKLEEKDKKYLNAGLVAGLLLLYFLGVSLFGVSLVVPYAFLWLMWVLDGIRSNGEKQKQTMAALEKRLEQVEAR